MKDDIFNRISPDEALEILRQLAKKDKELKKKIVELAEKSIRDVDVDEICEVVFFDLDGIDVHELWDRSGSSRDGYTSPEDMSFEMIEEVMDPYAKEMQRLLDLKMHQEAMFYCMGVLKGIYRYEKESESEFKNWATDIPGEIFRSVLKKWGKGRNKEDKMEMKDFIHEQCPDWFE